MRKIYRNRLTSRSSRAMSHLIHPLRDGFPAAFPPLHRFLSESIFFFLFSICSHLHAFFPHTSPTSTPTSFHYPFSAVSQDSTCYTVWTHQRVAIAQQKPQTAPYSRGEEVMEITPPPPLLPPIPVSFRDTWPKTQSPLTFEIRTTLPLPYSLQLTTPMPIFIMKKMLIMPSIWMDNRSRKGKRDKDPRSTKLTNLNFLKSEYREDQLSSVHGFLQLLPYWASAISKWC